MTTEAPTPGNKSPSPGLAKVLLPVAVIVLAVVGALFVLRARQPQTTTVPHATDSGGPAVADMRIGATLPDFQLHPFKGASSEIAASSLRGRISLINFWATWCEACMVEMPSIVKLYQGYKDRGFDVVAVDLDTNPEVVLPRTIQRYGMNFSVYTDTDSKLADLFQVQAIPLSIVIDRSRKILLIENEGLDWNGTEFRAALEKWLAG